MATRWIIGLSSGSSAEAVESALLEVNGVGLHARVRPVQWLRQPLPPDLCQLMLAISATKPAETRHVSLLHRVLGETFASAARKVADRASFSLQRVQCIGCSGHSVWHETDGRFPSSLNLGMAAVVAERTGVTTIADFSARDLAVGGHGVPLCALADYLLFHHPHEHRLLLHLGGVARIVFIPAAARLQDLMGFEAAPCNVLLNALMRQMTGGRESFDPGGKHAVQGRCLEPLLERWLAHPALQRRPPRSISLHVFGEEFASQTIQLARKEDWALHDLLCTANHFVVRNIADAVKRYVPAPSGPVQVLLSGGGTRNGLLWQLLEQQLPGWPLARTDTAGVPLEVRKPLAHGVLAALAVDGVPANVPAMTGAAGARLLGSMTPGSPTNWGRCLAWMAQQAGLPEPSEE